MNNKIESIQVFGSGCPTCHKLFELVKQAASDLQLKVEAEYVTDIQKIIDLGMISSPVLVVNGKILLAGQIPSLEKIKELLKAEEKFDSNNQSETCHCGHC